MGLLDLFGFGRKKQERILEMLTDGGLIVDVRSKAEFDTGFAPNSINIPFELMNQKMGKLKKMGKPIVLCCATGRRSGMAVSMLNNSGIECINAGSWRKLA